MHFLARMLHRDDEVSAELANDHSRLYQDLQRFFQSYQVKQRVLDALLQHEPAAFHLQALQQALAEEITLIEEGEHAEHEILTDLKYLSREHYIMRLESLLKDLGEAERQDEYAEKLLEELRDTLLSEARKVRRMLKGDVSIDTTQELTDLLLIERHIVERLAGLGDFRRLFGNLALGEIRRQALTRAEERMRDRIGQLVKNVELDEHGVMRSTDGHYISQFAARIFNRLEDAVMQAVEDGTIAQRPDVDIAYVNSPYFEQFVQDELQLDARVGKVIPSPRTIVAFIQAFRQLYNGQVRVIA